ncbi:MAG: bifunctional phosphopantothenoylcysteine decarboxylase/phosphopantothenate--cysteine ligase CoaBC [Proteiniphilum sp.]|jgi:phosphopantothenoylcysteine decarboxylase/phosphopantothenate--cysteine ligase|nr:bifunctional phosphopantothenoylcysteine decarboxylase/phosphopantothenate--cysteine ligase CoaBC [Proteiniphilum sp.]
MSLQGKHIVLGITGSIAAYKSAVLTRLLVKRGAEVQIVITPAGKEFITPVTLSALSGRPVVSEFFAAGDGSWHSHVELGLWADLMVVAPATAASIGKMAGGIADNMLITTYLSMKAPVFVAPAMDLDMYRHVSTRRNIELLKGDGVQVISAVEGELASHLCGEGRMEEPENIVAAVERFFAGGNGLGKKRIVITAGPTFERIDPVRFIGNFSSGKMGFALAGECARRGAEVILITGPTALSAAHPGIRRVDVESAREMYDAALKVFPQADAAILSAAVADYRPERVCGKKIKRAGRESFTLSLVSNPDIAAALGKMKRPGQLTVGFALETEEEERNAIRKMEEKNLDCIVLNSLNDEGAGFGYDTNRVTLLSRSGERRSFPLKSKVDVARDIIDAVFDASRNSTACNETV